MAGIGFEVCSVQAECVDWNRRGCSLPIEYPTFSNSGLLKRKSSVSHQLRQARLVCDALWNEWEDFSVVADGAFFSQLWPNAMIMDDSSDWSLVCTLKMKHYWDNRSSDILGSIYTLVSLEVQQIGLCTSWNFHSLCFVFKDRQTRIPKVRWMLHFQKLSKLVLRIQWL